MGFAFDPVAILAGGTAAAWLLVITLAWVPLMRGLAALLLLRDHQRASEFPNVLARPGAVFWALAASTALLPHLADVLRPSLGSGPAQHLVATLVLAALRVATGVALWFAVARALGVFHREIVQRTFREYGQDRQRNVSLVLYQLAHPALALLAFAFVAWLFGLDLAGYLLALGGLSLAVAFGLQRLLENVFSSLSLSLDAPFSRNDLIRLGSDPTIYQVLDRGLRMTRVRDIETHEIVYLPNRKLTEEPLFDVNRPTDDVRAVIEVGVSYSADLRRVQSILLGIAWGNPHVVGPFAEKSRAMVRKLYRLFLVGGWLESEAVFEECREHFIELARLEAERDLNARILELQRQLQRWARLVDQWESRGFHAEEKSALREIAEELLLLAREIVDLTTEWQVHLRNCVARGRAIPEPSTSPAGPFPSVVADGLAGVLTNGITGDRTSLAAELEELERRGVRLRQLSRRDGTDYLSIENSSGWTSASPEAEDLIAELVRQRLEWLDRALAELGREPAGDGKISGRAADADPRPKCEAFQREAETVRRRLEAAHALSARVRVPPETGAFRRGYDEAADVAGRIAEQYAELGQRYVRLMRESVRWMVREQVLAPPESAPGRPEGDAGYWPGKQLRRDLEHLLGRGEGFSIGLCRSRGEDLYLSDYATEWVLDHGMCSALAGQITDADERGDLAEIMRIWGDKTAQLLARARSLGKSLATERSTAIDTELRSLGSWLTEEFKEPFPSWKNPIATVAEFADSAITVEIRFYVDNVRMERYMRMVNTLTELRVRIKERLDNEGISIPFPRRDVHLFRDLAAVGREQARDQTNGSGSGAATAHE